MLRLRKILLCDFIFIILALSSLIFSIIFTNCYRFRSKYNAKDNDFVLTLNNIKIDGNCLSIEGFGKEKIIGYYYIKSLKEKKYLINKLKIGDKLNVKGTLDTPNNNTIPNTFNYKKYLYNNRIYYVLKIDSIKKINNNSNIFNSVKNIIINKINNYKYSNKYLYAFILGDTSFIDNNITNSYSFNGISHLLAISGMHVGILSAILLFILKKIKVSENKSYFIVILFILFYIFITNYSPSILRSGIFFILICINKMYYFCIKPINLLLLTLFILILVNPFIIYYIGFQYSYIISLFLILFGNIINKSNNYIIKLFITPTIALLASLPINIYNFYSINLLSILLNLIFVPLITLIIFPLSLITFILPFFDKVLLITTNIFEYLSLLFSKIKVLNLVLARPNIFIILIYYFIIIIVLYKVNKNKYQYILILIIIIIIHSNIKYFVSNSTITFIDVGQGDSCLIELPNNEGNILIDTGGKLNFKQDDWEKRINESSIASTKLIPFFKSKGISKIDILILTHGDDDHMGEAIKLVNNFKVKEVLFNVGNYNNLEKELIKVLIKMNIDYHQNVELFNKKKYRFIFLNTKDYKNENDNSNVIYSKIDNVKLLLMGDAGIKREKDILNNYNLESIDFLKIGHHGSNTSSDKEFIKNISPKNCLISVGKNNRYGHPKQSVLNILDNCRIYRTDEKGSVEIKINKDKYIIKSIK